MEWKNLEGRVERSCWENQQRKNKLVVDLSKKHLKTWGEIKAQPNVWIAEKNEEMQNSTSKEYGELIALRDAEEKILKLLQEESW